MSEIDFLVYMSKMEKGVVLGVLDGSTLVIKFVSEEGKKVYAVVLSSISSPRLGSSDGTRDDEYEAWTAYNYTRQLTVGKRCVVVDFNKSELGRSHPNFGRLQLVYGRVELVDYDNMDVGMAIVEAGMARHKSNFSNDYANQLYALQNVAQNSKKGIWGDSRYIRKLPVEYKIQNLLDQKEFDGIIEYIANGYTYNVVLLPKLETITISLCGIKSPSAKRDSPEAYGAEARYFAELNFFQRNVHVTLLGYNDAFKQFVGQITYNNYGDIAIKLLEEGLATVFVPTMHFVKESDEKYKITEAKAKTLAKNIWKGLSDLELNDSTITGQVINLRGTSIIEILKDDDTTERVSLSGCKIPVFNPTTSSDPHSYEAFEFLRENLIGKRVRAVVDSRYEDRNRNLNKIYVTMTLVDENVIINEKIAAAGLCEVIVTQNGRPPACITRMMELEQEAREAGIGVFSFDTTTPPVITDLNKKYDRQRSSVYFSHVAGKNVTGIIQFFVTATKALVLIPEDMTLVAMNLLGVTFSDPLDRLGHEALQYCNKHFLLRDCDVFFRDVDKKGVFLGSITVYDGSNSYVVEAELLKRGFCDVGQSIARHPIKNLMINAKKVAQKSGVGIWSGKNRSAFSLERGEIYECRVLSVWDSCTVVIAMMTNEFKLMKQELPKCRSRPKDMMKGDVVGAIFGNRIFRARVTDIVDNKVKVDFIDLCVDDVIPIENLRSIPKEISDLPPQGLSVRLAFCSPFDNEEPEFRKDAEEYLWSACDGSKLYCHLVNDDINKSDPDVLLTEDPDIESGSVNAVMLRTGFVKFEMHEYPFDEAIDRVRETLDRIEVLAKEENVGAWEHGNEDQNIPDEADADYLI